MEIKSLCFLKSLDESFEEEENLNALSRQDLQSKTPREELRRGSVLVRRYHRVVDSEKMDDTCVGGGKRELL